ncbi:FKBP-type peptidyl-prolyl cis-trans isomerase [Myxococcota bacterium]|nr:FKBP-type peptidyl-prolyl cis-trans isomerase [Myxococcota bacterium]
MGRVRHSLRIASWQRLGLALIWVLTGGLGASGASAGDAETPLASPNERVLYALGLRCSNELMNLALNPKELRTVERGLRDGLFAEQVLLNDAAFDAEINAMKNRRRAISLVVESQAAEKYVARAAKESGAVMDEHGFVYIELKPGRGPSPGPDERVKVHFHGRLRDGRIFDSSVDDGSPRRVDLSRMFPCWRYGIARMKVGGVSRLVCSPKAGFGSVGTPRVPGGAALDIEVELLGIMR